MDTEMFIRAWVRKTAHVKPEERKQKRCGKIAANGEGKHTLIPCRALNI